MPKFKIKIRIKELETVLKYSSEFKVFSPGERICINQELGRLFRELAYLENECRITDIPNYIMPEGLQIKVENTIAEISKIGWYPKPQH